MNLKKQQDVLFISFLALFIITAGTALVGICISWKNPNIDFPYLNKLITITIVEVCGGIVLLFNKSFGLKNKKQEKDHLANNLENKAISIKDCFTLFKQCITVCSDNEINFRLHYLKYKKEDDTLLMVVQDDMYEDSHFEFSVEDGCKKDIVVCKALRRDGLVLEKLKADHYVKYPNIPIRKQLKEVMAFPIKTSDGKIAGVVSFDSDEEFHETGISEDKLGNLFLRLCKSVENIVNK